MFRRSLIRNHLVLWRFGRRQRLLICELWARFPLISPLASLDAASANASYVQASPFGLAFGFDSRWQRAADQIWDQSALLNARRQDHPISPATLTGMAKRGDCTCQHALFFLRWLGRTPESFCSGARARTRAEELPAAGPDQRLRWDLAALYAALNERRLQQKQTWRGVAGQLRCTEHQLTGIRTARFAIGMTLAMRIVQWLEHPASAFVCAAKW